MFRNYYLKSYLLLVVIVVIFLVGLFCFATGSIVQSLDVGYSFWDGFFSPGTVFDAFELKIDNSFSNSFLKGL